MLARFARYACLAGFGFALVSPAQAYNCNAAAVFDMTKKAVCANPGLAKMDLAEAEQLSALRARLGNEATRVVARDRQSFLLSRNRCARNVRCLDAIYSAQLRLYQSLSACVGPNSATSACVKGRISAHREQLHKSM
jgi:uncharacterized protein